jgi:RNA polymerase sigma-70 factor (ECF subfamily)
MVRHQRQLQGFILPLVGCLSAAQDVVQEAAIAVWERFDQYDPARPFLPWAMGIARNKAMMYLRRQRRYIFLSDELVQRLAEEAANQESLAEQRHQALQSCLAKLTDDDRGLVRARYGGDARSLQELADTSRRDLKSLYRRLALVRRQLRDCVNHVLATGDAI